MSKISWRKATLLVYMVAVFTRKGSFCALVDTDDAFDCIRAEAAGMVLDNVLWICCKQKREGNKGNRIQSFKSVRHPAAGGNQNNCRNNTEENEWKQGQQRNPANSTHSGQSNSEHIFKPYNFNSLERAFKAADILLHHGGFALIAVDLSCIDEARLRKVPLTTWFRFARVADETQTALVFLTSSPLPFSCIGFKLHVDGSSASWSSKETKHVESRYASESLEAANGTEKKFRTLLEQYG